MPLLTGPDGAVEADVAGLERCVPSQRSQRREEMEGPAPGAGGGAAGDGRVVADDIGALTGDQLKPWLLRKSVSWIVG